MYLAYFADIAYFAYLADFVDFAYLAHFADIVYFADIADFVYSFGDFAETGGGDGQKSPYGTKMYADSLQQGKVN